MTSINNDPSYTVIFCPCQKCTSETETDNNMLQSLPRGRYNMFTKQHITTASGIILKTKMCNLAWAHILEWLVVAPVFSYGFSLFFKEINEKRNGILKVVPSPFPIDFLLLSIRKSKGNYSRSLQKPSKPSSLLISSYIQEGNVEEMAPRGP